MNRKKLFLRLLLTGFVMCLGLALLVPDIQRISGKWALLMAMQGFWQLETLEGKFPNGRIGEFNNQAQFVIVGPILYYVNDKRAAWLDIEQDCDRIAVDLRFSLTNPLMYRPSIIRLSGSGRLEIVLGMDENRPQSFDLSKEKPGTVRMVLRKVP